MKLFLDPWKRTFKKIHEDLILRTGHVDDFPPTYENHMTFQGYKYTGSLHLAISIGAIRGSRL